MIFCHQAYLIISVGKVFMDLEFLEQQVLQKGPKMMTPSRWDHSLRTADYALFLAEYYGADEKRSRFAALAHDMARDKSPKTQEQWARRELGEIPSFMEQAPLLYHGPASAWYLREKLGCRDESVLKAVCYHTTGHPALDAEGLVVFAADFMEPGRRHLDHRDRETLLKLSLDGLCIAILDSMESHLATRGIDPAPWSRELSLCLKNRYNRPL